MKTIISTIARLSELGGILTSWRSAASLVAKPAAEVEEYMSTILDKKHGVFLEYHDTTEFAACSGAGAAVSSASGNKGFAHISPSFSSVGMVKICTASPFVLPEGIESGALDKLILDTEAVAHAMGGKRLLIKTDDELTQKMLSAHPDYDVDMYASYSKVITKEADEKAVDTAIEITRAVEATPEIVALFNNYRIFYKKEDDLESCNKYISEKFAHNESIIFTAKFEEHIVGFVQFYPTYSTTELAKAMTLNDLYVDEAARSHGVATALMQYTEEYFASQGVERISLKTAPDNPARALYERLGFIQEADMCYYRALEDGASDGCEMDLTGLEATIIPSTYE